MTTDKQSFLESNIIFEKLKMLDFEKEFQEKKKLKKPIFQDYFAMDIDSGEQFLTFKKLMKWLLYLFTNKRDFKFYDISDPISVSSTLIEDLKECGINVDIQPLKLKNGFGPETCEIISLVLDKIIKNKIKFSTPHFPMNKENREQDRKQEEDSEIDIVGSIIDDDDDDDELIGQEEIENDKQIIETKGDEKSWYIEVEKNANKLNINSRQDIKEWRLNIDSSKKYNNNLKDLKANCSKILEKISEKINNSLEKISSNENTINNSLSEYSNKIKIKTDKKKEINEKIKYLLERTKELDEENEKLTEKNENLQKKLKEKTNIHTDEKPLKIIKKTYDDLKDEIKFMDVKIGILNNLILKGNLNEKNIIGDQVLNNFNHQNNHFTGDDDVLEVLS